MTRATKKRGGWTGPWCFCCCTRTPVFLENTPNLEIPVRNHDIHCLDTCQLQVTEKSLFSFPKEFPSGQNEADFSHFLLIFTRNFVFPPPQFCSLFSLKCQEGRFLTDRILNLNTKKNPACVQNGRAQAVARRPALQVPCPGPGVPHRLAAGWSLPPALECWFPGRGKCSVVWMLWEPSWGPLRDCLGTQG